jgi:hypothetical protein
MIVVAATAAGSKKFYFSHFCYCRISLSHAAFSYEFGLLFVSADLFIREEYC